MAKRSENRNVPTLGNNPPQLAVIGTIDVNYQLCTGCRLCEVACSLKKAGSVGPALSRIRVYQYYPGPVDIPVLCHQCSDHPCLAACPPKVAAIYLDKATGAMKVNAEKCVGVKCSRCLKACRHGAAITFHPQIKEALVCDLCDGGPECAKVCPTGALSFLPGKSQDGLHYAVLTPKKIAESLAFMFYPVRKIK